MPENGLEAVDIYCPYCGESIEIVVDCSAGEQSYAEDCRVCCRPIDMDVSIDEAGAPIVRSSREDEA